MRVIISIILMVIAALVGFFFGAGMNEAMGGAILLFAIIISLCSSGMGLLVIGIGIVGLIFSIIGFMERK